MQQICQASQRRTCQILGVSRTTVRYESVKDDTDLIDALSSLRVEFETWGYRKLTDVLRQRGWHVSDNLDCMVHKPSLDDNPSLPKKITIDLAAGSEHEGYIMRHNSTESSEYSLDPLIGESRLEYYDDPYRGLSYCEDNNVVTGCAR